MKYRVLSLLVGRAKGEVFELPPGSIRAEEWLRYGWIERIHKPNDLCLRVCEYQKRILSGDVTLEEVVFLRGMTPPTVARIWRREGSNGFAVRSAGFAKAFHWVDFDPIDWSLYWVDSGLRIQRWEDLKEGYVYQIAEGNYPHRPGADEAAEAECEKRRRVRKAFDMKEIEVTVGGHKVTGVDENFSYGKCEHKPMCYGKDGILFDILDEEQRRAGLRDRQAMREKIATRLGVSTRHISEDSINYELAIKGAARVASNLAEKRAPENDRMGRQMRDADIKGFLSSRFNLWNDPDIDHANHEVSLFVLFGDAEVEVTFGVNLQKGGWHWSSGERDDVWSTTLAMACDEFEAWVRDQFVEEESAAPREVVTRHIGTVDMGSRGTGGHR